MAAGTAAPKAPLQPPVKAVPAAVSPQVPLKKAVWVIMKNQASLARVAAGTDWKTRGQAVYVGLTTTAATSQVGVRSLLSARNATFKPFWIVNALRVTADQATLDEVAKRSDVARIVPDAVYQIPPLQPSARQSVQTLEWNLSNIRAPEVWNQFGAQGDGIVVANIDTGVQFDHPALVRQYRGNLGNGTFDHNYNWFDPASVCGSPSAAPCDNVAHGSHTMGTMIGDDQNGNQIGVAPHARWIAAKGCESNSCTLESLLSAGQWILAPTDLNGLNPRTDMRPHIVNNSWGGPTDTFYQATVQAWVAAGIFPAFASGNAGPGCSSTGSPGDYPESYAVGAYDINNFLAFFSSRGPSLLDGAIKPNISAPGVDVRSSVPGNGYDVFSGTSMATPHMAGAVALLWSAAPSLIGDIGATRALFDQAAIDAPDFSCGGFPENNNGFGQGRLDVFQAVSLAPTGPTGTLQGTVTTADGQPIARSVVRAQSGTTDRRTQTDPGGNYRLTLPEGTYTVTASAFGFLTQTATGVAITSGNTTPQSFPLPAAPSFAVTGFVHDSGGLAVAGAQVAISNPGLVPAITDASGRYAFPSVPAGDYQITASTAGGCYGTATSPLSVAGDIALDFVLPLRPDSFGYVCRTVATDFIDANNVLFLSGDDSSVQVPLPFPFSFYGQSYTTADVTTNGFLSFQPSFPSFSNSGIPDPNLPNAAVFAFWDDLYVDPSVSSVRTETVGSAPDRQFVIEWRDVAPLGRPDLLLGFEIVLSESGAILMRYRTAEPDPIQRGASASVGIENETGTIGVQYSVNQPALSSGLGIAYVSPPSGVVQGTITDANDGRPIAGATIRGLASDGSARATQSGVDGTYVLRLAVGDYNLEATFSDYSVERATASVAQNAVVVRNFALRTGRAAVTPATIQLTAPVNQVRTRTLTLANSGSASFDFSIHESGGALQSAVSTARLARNPVVDRTARTTRGLYATGVTAQGLTPMAAGDIIRTFPATGAQLAWGVGYTGNVWVGDWTGRQDLEFTPLGAATGRHWPTNWSGGFAADMAYVPGRNLLCHVNGTGDNGIYCTDPNNGNVVSSIVGAFPWTVTPQRGLAYRADDDSFYIGGWLEGVIYHVRGLSAANPGEVIGSCRPADGNISGLAYNGGAGVLWVATNSPTDTIYELNPDDCTVLSTLAHPAPGFSGAGLDMDEAGNLWVMAQSINQVYLIDSGVPAFVDVPWLSVTPVSGTVAVGASQRLTVTVDTHGLAPGLHLASLFIQTSTAHEKVIRVPVSLLVPDYQQGVNAGGNAYVDALGDTWAADQKLVTGGWGYFQKSKTATTTRTITGTTDQPLFRSQRIDPYAYRFENVPNGTYQVELRFAEIQGSRAGKRLFDVIVEDTLVLPAHDIVFEVGALAAESRSFFVDVVDGRMDIRLIPRAKSDLPVINAARITHRNDR